MSQETAAPRTGRGSPASEGHGLPTTVLLPPSPHHHWGWGKGCSAMPTLTSLSVAPLCGCRSPPPSPPAVPGIQEELVSNTELVQSYRQQISNVVNQANLQLFWNMYNRYGRPGGRMAAPRGEGSHSWGIPDSAVRGRRPVAGRLAEEQTIQPPTGVTSCPGSHPWRGRGRAGLVRSSSTPGIAGRSSGGCGHHPCSHHPEPQC